MAATNSNAEGESNKETIANMEVEISELQGAIKKLGQIGVAGFVVLLIAVFLFFSHLATMFDNDATSCVTGILMVLMLPAAFMLRKKWDAANSQLSEKQKALKEMYNRQ